MNNQTDPSKPKSGRDISPSVVKLNKVENMTGFEKLRDGRPSIKVPSNNQNIKQEVKQEIKQEFIPDPNSMVVSIGELIKKFREIKFHEFFQYVLSIGYFLH